MSSQSGELVVHVHDLCFVTDFGFEPLAEGLVYVGVQVDLLLPLAGKM